MNTNVASNFQIRLITFGLLAIIPITIDLGLKFIFPKEDWDTYRKLENEYLEKNMPNYDQYEKELKISDNPTSLRSKKRANLFSSATEYKKQWTESEQYKELKATDKKHDQYRMITLCFLMIVIMSILIFINIPIIHTSILFAGLLLFIFNLNQFSTEITNSLFLFIPLDILRIVTSLICLLLALYIVHKNND